jgi:hypothetical protein
MVTWVAEPGGYLDRKGDGPPGPQAMWVGWRRVRDFALTWTALRHPDPKPKRWVER